MNIRTKKMRRRLVPMLVLSALTAAVDSSSHSYAVTGLAKCDVYVVGETQVPEDLRSRMAQEGDSAARACLTPSGKWTKYVSLSRIWVGRFGVCEFTATADGQRTARPTVMMAIATTCPSKDSSLYVATSGVSEGLFANLVKFWSRVSSSPEAFRNAFTTVDKRIPLADEDVRLLYTQIFNRTKDQKPALVEIELSPMTGNLADEKYNLVLSNPADNSKQWWMYVDLAQGGFTVLRLQSASF
jgi:hypothetical protein